MSRHTWIVFVLFVTSVNADEARVIQLHHRPAAEMIPLVQPLLGPNDAIAGTNYRLIVRTSDKNFGEIEKLLAQFDTERRQLRITVKQSGALNARDSDIGVSGQAGNGNTRVRIQRNRPTDSRGVTIGEQGGLHVETQSTMTTTRDDATQFITTQDGAHAFIRVGQSVPHVTYILTLTGNQAILSQGVVLQDIVTGFDVMPQVQGRNVLVEITPRLSRLQDPKTGLADFQQYSTSVVVRPGEWIDIGGLSGNGEQVRRAILESGSTQTTERRTVLLKVD